MEKRCAYIERDKKPVDYYVVIMVDGDIVAWGAVRSYTALAKILYRIPRPLRVEFISHRDDNFGGVGFDID